MIPCNGSHVITHDYKHGDSIYRCTLANAQKLLDQMLKDEAQHLAKVVAQLKDETRPVRSVGWLTKALTEVCNQTEPRQLRALLHGGAPREGEDTRPVSEITEAMQQELVMFCFHRKLSLDVFQGRQSMSLEQVMDAWKTLAFLQPARTRLGEDIVLLEDYLYEGYSDLTRLQSARWKDTAKEENIVGSHYCPLLNAWGSGRWSVEAVVDA